MFAPSAVSATNVPNGDVSGSSVSTSASPSSHTKSRITIGSKDAQQSGQSSASAAQVPNILPTSGSQIPQSDAQLGGISKGSNAASPVKADNGAKPANSNSQASTPATALSAREDGNITYHDAATKNDDVKVSKLQLASMQTGEVPFDSNDDQGNDSSASNNIVRSFDKVTYDYSYTLTPASPTDYYRDARIRFDVHVPVNKTKAVIDTASMTWIDQDPQYPSTETDNPDGTQDYVFWRHVSNNTPGGYVAPGTASVIIILKINAMNNGEKIKPTVNARSEYTGDTAGQTDIPQELTISAKTSLDIRIGANAGNGYVTQASPVRTFDFDKPGAEHQPNYGLGKQRGYITGLPWAVDLRWPDSDLNRGKGMKGLEAPQGDLKFTVNTVDNWCKDTSTDQQCTDGPGRATNDESVQTKFWGLAPATTPIMSHADAVKQKATPSTPGRELNNDTQGYMPRFDNYTLAGGFRTHKDTKDHNVTYDNGDYTVEQGSRGAGWASYNFTLKDYAIGPFWARQGSSIQGDTGCDETFMGNNCTTQKIGEISTGYLYLFHPVTMSDEQIGQTYGTGITALDQADEGGLQYTDAEGNSQDYNHANGMLDRSDQASGDNDNWRPNRISLVVPGSIAPFFGYACATDHDYEEDGVDCGGWMAADDQQDTDVASPGDPIRLTPGYVFTQQYSGLPVGHMILLKIDPKVIDLEDENHLDAGGYSGKNGFFHSWNDPNPFWNKASPVKAKYAVKPNGSGWSSDAEQDKAGIDDLKYYDTKAEAQSHGTIVGILLASNQAALSSSEGIETKFSMGNIKAKVRADAPMGRVAQLSAVAYMYTRGQMKTAKQLSYSLDGDDTDWLDWSTAQNPMDWYFKDNLKGKIDTATFQNNYKKPAYDENGYVANSGTGTHVRQWGDALYVAGEKPAVDISVAQRTGSVAKSVYDLDKRERSVDWAIAARVHSMSGNGKTDVSVTATLPKGLHYVENSSKLDGDYQQHVPDPGTVIGGTLLKPTITNNPDGTTTLVWQIPDVARDDRNRAIHFSTTIGDEIDPGKDVKDGADFQVKASVMSTNYHVAPNASKGTLDSAGMRVSKLRAASLATQAKQLINETSEPVGYISTFGNYAQADESNPYAVEIMPYNDHKLGTSSDTLSTYHGTYGIKNMKIKPQGGASLNGLVVRYSTDTHWRSKDVNPATITRVQVDDWPTADLVADGHGDYTVSIAAESRAAMPANGITAMAFELPMLPPSGSVQIDTTLAPNGNKAGDKYEQQWADGSNNVIALLQTYDRTVSGFLWYDYNHNGIMDSTEPILSNIGISLVNDAGATVNDVYGHPLKAKTQNDGSYLFDGVPAGSGYRVKLDVPDGWGLTKANQGSDRTVNSKADKDAMRGSGISLNEFPTSKEMSSPLYEDTYENAGFVGPLEANKASFDITKKLEGRDWTSGEKYKFNITPVGDAPATGSGQALPSSVTVGGTGSDIGKTTVNIDADKLRLPSPGPFTYVYTITEDTTDLPAGVSQASGIPTEYKLTITVKDNFVTYKKDVTATLTDASGAAVTAAAFTNTYKPSAVPVVLKASKELKIGAHQSHAPLAGNEFNFTMTPVSQPDGSTTITAQHASNDADGNITFPGVSFDKAGDYVFDVTEDATSETGISRDQTVWQAKWTITDNQHGNLVIASHSVNKKGEAPADGIGITFNNTYKPNPTTAHVGGNKVIRNTDSGTAPRQPKDGEFTFTIADAGGKYSADSSDVSSPMPSKTSVTNGSDGSFKFPDVTYSAPGVYKYTVKEQAGHDSTISQYDDSQYTATVTVTDESGKLKASVSYALAGEGESATSATFTNVYTPTEADAVLSADKHLKGRDLQNREFQATLEEDGHESHAPANGSQTADFMVGSQTSELPHAEPSLAGTRSFVDATSGTGHATFKTLRFTHTGDYHYTIREASGSRPRVTYDTSVQHAVVSVREDADSHKLVASVTYTDAKGHSESVPTFTNAYTPVPPKPAGMMPDGQALAGKKLAKTGADAFVVASLALLALALGLLTSGLERSRQSR
ncbi:FctA domain-containing protein [Bifidobacterium sp. ESL0704]|uniref:Spy0128 family protein n=1 Tax=Bifidobacterium sp. ESL0704 TaxID=2983219 RepID=UPI0023F69141|nr:FctA domain-containing protein [Bifidobacterium sp. ESL0704]WEV52908.1 hypothetical protein OZX64_08665 [Bifidobacterium sp. ESL0704]